MTKQSLSIKKGWVVRVTFFIAALVACGAAVDGTNPQTSSLPGTGGTGIYATGQITGFGSIILSNLKFDDQTAQVRIDGVSADPSYLRLGMVANVLGEIAPGQTKATATRIEVWSVAQGEASGISNNQISVGGMTFSVDSSTVLDGFASLHDMSVNTRLRVWAIPTNSATRHWAATRIALADSNDWVTTGQLLVGSEGSSVNGYILPNALSRGLSAGQLVRVAVLINPSNGLPSVAVTDVTPDTQLHNLNAQVEGHVTEVIAGQQFMLDHVVVDASQAQFNPGPFYLAPGIHLVVDGVWESGVLKATTITYLDAQALALVELSGPVRKFESLSKFYVRNTECDASVISNLDEETLTKLSQGANVKVLGTKAGHTIKVYHLELI